MWRRLTRIWSSPRTVLRSVLALDDTSHAIALGAAIGMLVGMTPTVGLQTIVVMAVALSTHRLFYFNRAAALLTIYISNPLTVVPIYYGLYWVGTHFLPGTASVEQFRDILDFEGFAGWWAAICQLMFDVGRPLCVGTLIVAPICGLITYPATLGLLPWFRGTDDDGTPDHSNQDAAVTPEESSEPPSERSSERTAVSAAITCPTSRDASVLAR